MNRCVEVNELKSAVQSWLAVDRYYHPYSKGKTIPVSELMDIIDHLPTASPVSNDGKDDGRMPSEVEAM